MEMKSHGTKHIVDKELPIHQLFAAQKPYINRGTPSLM